MGRRAKAAVTGTGCGVEGWPVSKQARMGAGTNAVKQQIGIQRQFNPGRLMKARADKKISSRLLCFL